MAARKLQWGPFSGDAVHPSDLGNRLHADRIAAFLQPAWAQPLAPGAQMKDYPTPKPLDARYATPAAIPNIHSTETAAVWAGYSCMERLPHICCRRNQGVVSMSIARFARSRVVLLVSFFTALSAAAAMAVDPPATAPSRNDTPQLWVHQPPRELTALDPADTAKPEISLVGVRNGRFASQIVIASAKPIRGLSAKASALAGADGKASLPATQITLRYALPGEMLRNNFFVGEHRFDGLVTSAPAEVPTRKVRTGWRGAGLEAGAVQPIWITIQVPADLPAQVYTGKVTVQADGLPATDVPVTIKIHDWTLPKVADYFSHDSIWQSQESSALHYGVELWSAKHFALMGQALELTAPMANTMCNVHLITGAYHQNNSESMIRWVKKGENEYEYDFSIFDRYLDLYAAKIGKPHPLLLTVYHPYVDARPATQPNGPMVSARVSLLDKATGKVTSMRVPDYGTPEAVAFWKPLFAEIFTRLDKRGWSDSVVLGTSSDNGPRTPGVYTTFRETWPECRLMFSGHPNPGQFKTASNTVVPVTCREHVWGAGGLRKTYPLTWKAAPRNYQWAFSRAGSGACNLIQFSDLSAYRHNAEMCLQSGNNGLGRAGIDFYTIPGRPTLMCGNSGAHIGPAASITAMTFAGPTGPVTTARLEVYIEGVQVREAISYLLDSLDKKKITGDLATRCTEYLNKRAESHLRFQPKSYNLERGTPFIADWQQRDDALFALCVEVAKAVGTK